MDTISQNELIIESQDESQETPIYVDEPGEIGEASPLSWLTGEVLLYAVLVVLALGIRLANLGYYPLNDIEAGQALVSWTIFRGEIPTEATNYSPLMATLNSFTFLIFGPSDVTARLGTALLGLILVLLPLGLRRQLGPVGALTASTLFAFSAVSLFWSRVTSGEMAVAVGALMVLVGVIKWLAEGVGWGLFFIAAGGALLFISAPSGFTALVVLVVLILFMILIDRNILPDLQVQLNRSRDTVKQALLVFGGLLVILSTAALFNLMGLAAISDMFNAWLGQFGLAFQAGAGYPAVLMLFLYEPVIVLFGGLGIIRSFGERDLFDWVLVIWLGIMIMLDLLMGGRSGGQILLVLAPLTLLASRSISVLFSQWQQKARLEIEGLFIGFGIVLSVFVYISLTSWSKCVSSQPGCETAWVLPAAGLALIGILFAVFWGWYEAGTAWRGLSVLLLVITSLISMGISWRLNYAPLKDLPYQLMVSYPASTRFLTLLDDISRLSAEQTGDRHQIDLAVINLDRPILRWYLRDFTNVRYISTFAEGPATSVIVAPVQAGEPMGGAYAGQDLALISHWTPELLVGKEWIRWYLFRFLPHHKPGFDEVILWVRQEYRE